MILINNDNTSTAYGWAAGGDGTYVRRVAQSFTLTEPTIITGAKFRAGLASGSAFDMTVTIETNNAGAPLGTLAHANFTTTVTGESGVGSTQYAASFVSASLAAGTYWLVVKKASEGTSNNYYTVWCSTTTSTYAGGNVSSYADSYTAYANDDMYFQILGQDSGLLGGEI
jgi:hypothetical protein